MHSHSLKGNVSRVKEAILSLDAARQAHAMELRIIHRALGCIVDDMDTGTGKQDIINARTYLDSAIDTQVVVNGGVSTATLDGKYNKIDSCLKSAYNLLLKAHHNAHGEVKEAVSTVLTALLRLRQ